MKIYKNQARLIAAAAVLTMSVTASAASDYMVTMNTLKSSIPQILDFGKSVITDTDTLVPARPLAERAGMYIDWEQASQTATITLYSCAWGENKIERHASELMDSVNTYGLDVSPYSITADFELNDNTATLRYNYKDSEDDIISIGKEVEISTGASMVDDGTLMVPLKSSMEMFGLEVEIDNRSMSADIKVPDTADAPDDMGFMAEKKPVIKEAEVKQPEPVQESAAEVSKGKYLGRFLITHYCPCNVCNGGWGANTAWAGKIAPGRTIAVDPTVIPKLATVYIDGYGYRTAEDCGGGIKGNHIDMAVSSHSEAMSKGVVYKDVYLAE